MSAIKYSGRDGFRFTQKDIERPTIYMHNEDTYTHIFTFNVKINGALGQDTIKLNDFRVAK